MASDRLDDMQVLSEAEMKEQATKELITAVRAGDEEGVRSALARGAHPKVTVPIDARVSWCLMSGAANKGHHHLLPCLLQAGLNIEGGGSDDLTPLMVAAVNARTLTVKALLTLGANPLATDSEGRTALHHAAMRGHQQCVAVLMPVTPPTPAHLEVYTPVHVASYHGHVKVLNQLSSAGWPLMARDIDGNTPLHSAAMGGSMACIEWLEKRCGDQHMENKAGQTPHDTELVTAVTKGNEAGVKSALARGARPEVTVSTNAGVSWCLVCAAASMGHDHVVPHLLQAGLNIEGGGTDDMTPLMQASANGHTQTVQTLLTLHANPLATDSKGWTALHHAAHQGHQQCVAALMPVIPPTPADLEEHTPVHIASNLGLVEVLKQLAGADWPLTARDRYGRTPLHHAAAGGDVSTVQWLVQQGGDLHVKDLKGHTPVDMAVQHGKKEVEAWLYKNSGGVVRSEDLRVEEVREWRNVHEDDYKTILSWLVDGNVAAIKANIPEPRDGHVLSQEGLTPLHAAALNGAPSVAVEALIGRGVHPHVLTPDNMTPADLAQQKGHDPVIKGLQCYHCKQDGGEPPKHLYEELLSTVSRGDDVQAVSSLLCKGAPIEHLGGRSVLKLAVTTDRIHTVCLLLASGASLTATLLQEAWQSSCVTHRVLASLTTAYCCRLRAEQRRLGKVSRAFVEGISNLLEDIEGNTPWLAAWRLSEDTDRATLSDLLSKASAANCCVTAAFLQRAEAWPFYSPVPGTSALHSALDAGHQSMAEMLIRDLGGCPYVPDTHGSLPLSMMTNKERQKLEQRLFEEERDKLKDMVLRQKADREKMAARRALGVQKVLYNNYEKGGDENVSADDGRASLLLAARKGLLQLTHLLLREARCPVDEVLDDTCGTTALHQAASHGQDCCVALLVSAGANTQQCDTYGQTPRHLAAMFGYTSTVDLLTRTDVQDSPCRAGTTAKQVEQGFQKYLQLYEKHGYNSLTPFDRHNPDRVTRKLMKCIGVGKLQQQAQRVAVDLSGGEALQIRQTVMAELRAIMDIVSASYPSYRGDLRLVGSSQDGSKLYAPDEFDVNVVIHEDGVEVNVNNRGEEEASLKGKLQISLSTNNQYLQGNKFMTHLYEEVHRCLAGYTLQDKRLSLVPPGLTSTQVGVALALAWQGQEYPLLLVGVDLVPVLEVQWPEKIPKPLLTPEDNTSMQLSNAADGTWRCSFALTEANVLETLSPAERQVLLMGKILLSLLKAECWMPRHKKSFCTWFATRDWNIPVPSGFCLKNAFLRWLEHRRCEEWDRAKKLGLGWEGDPAKQQGAEQKGNPVKQLKAGREENLTKQLGEGQEEDSARWLVEVFRLMCANPEDSREHLTAQNSSAYFGGDCEGRKPGDGAPIIVQCLEQDLEKLCSGSVGQRDLRPRSHRGLTMVKNMLMTPILWMQKMQLILWMQKMQLLGNDLL